jgi:hypothetical protein
MNKWQNKRSLSLNLQNKKKDSKAQQSLKYSGKTNNLKISSPPSNA